MIEWGLCCIFREEPIRFRRATAASLRPLPRPEQLRKLAALIRSNAENLKKAFECCAELKIGAFRINSELLMLATHAEAGYRLEELPEAGALRSLFDEAKRCADQLGLRRSLHPDQFVVLNSPDPRVRADSRAELEHQLLLAELCGATEINLHAGGVYGDKSAALDRRDAQRKLRGALCGPCFAAARGERRGVFPERAVVVEKQPHVQPRVRDAERRVHSLRRGARDRLDRRFFKHVSSFHRRTALRQPSTRVDSRAKCAAALLILVYTKVHGKYRYLQKHCGAEVRHGAPPAGHARHVIKNPPVRAL